MTLSARENWLRAVEYRYPEWVPCSVSFSPLAWRMYGEELERIVLAHPRLFPGYRAGTFSQSTQMPLAYRKGERYTDNWGCGWYNEQDGLEGQVIEHPLADWAALEAYRMPDPLRFSERGLRDWARIERSIAAARAEGQLVSGDGERLFDRLYFLRGWQSLMVDIATDAPQLARLIAMLEEHEAVLIERWLSLGVDSISFHTDIGTQKGLMISPKSFRKHLKPMFTRLFQRIRRAGAHVYLSSDGRLLELVDDLIECGVSVHDPQLRANTLDGIVQAYKGRLCANVDLDRQGFPFLTPQQIDEQIKTVVDRMAAPEGGLMVMAAVYGADIPLRNIEAICAGMERYCFP